MSKKKIAIREIFEAYNVLSNVTTTDVKLNYVIAKFLINAEPIVNATRKVAQPSLEFQQYSNKVNTIQNDPSIIDKDKELKILAEEYNYAIQERQKQAYEVDQVLDKEEIIDINNFKLESLPELSTSVVKALIKLGVIS